MITTSRVIVKPSKHLNVSSHAETTDKQSMDSDSDNCIDTISMEQMYNNSNITAIMSNNNNNNQTTATIIENISTLGEETNLACQSEDFNIDGISFQPSISLETSSSLDDSSLADESTAPITMDVADVFYQNSQAQYNNNNNNNKQLQQVQNLPRSHNENFEGGNNSPRHDLSLRDGDSLIDDQLESIVNTISTTTEMEVDSITEYNVQQIMNPAHPAVILPPPIGNTDAINKGHKRTQSSVSCRSTASHRAAATALQMLPGATNRFHWVSKSYKSSGIGEPSVWHALVVIFLEFFAWGLLTMPVIAVLNQTFPDHTFLMNGLVMGIKGILSFLSAPLIGALSDIWGRKFFLLITVFFTCAPIPLMTINTWWFFAMISISGVFAVTFSVVFAYVADVSTVEERSRAYGLVSATFAASLVISPALGAALMDMYGETLVVALATAIAVLDVFFILVAVPESLPEKVRPSASWGAPISWEQADPFAALRKVGTDYTILMQCVTVLLSYLPEAGQYSCIFVYLKLKMDFNSMEVAIFIAIVGILSIGIQVTLGYLMRVFGAKRTIILGLLLEMVQLLWYGFGSQAWMMWAAGVLAALGSITYPAISAFVSIHSNANRQGAVQGMVTGMRGLCNGLGPAMFGVIFYLFNVDLNDEHASIIVGGLRNANINLNHTHHRSPSRYEQLAPGPPFVFGAFMVLLAILVAIFMPETHADMNLGRVPSEKKRCSLDVQYEIECGQKSTSPLAPLMRSDSLAQL